VISEKFLSGEFVESGVISVKAGKDDIVFTQYGPRPDKKEIGTNVS
jgi:hypothetical protein